MGSKPCSWCGIEKRVTEFSKDKSQKSGLTPRCKLCLKNPDPAIRVTKVRKGCLTAYCNSPPFRDGYCRKHAAEVAVDNLLSLEKWTRYYEEKGWL